MSPFTCSPLLMRDEWDYTGSPHFLSATYSSIVTVSLICLFFHIKKLPIAQKSVAHHQRDHLLE